MERLSLLRGRAWQCSSCCCGRAKSLFRAVSPENCFLILDALFRSARDRVFEYGVVVRLRGRYGNGRVGMRRCSGRNM